MEYTEEEKKAIEEAKNQIVECDNLDNLNCFLTDSTTLKILLNLIEKQKEIIEHYKENCYAMMFGHNKLVDYYYNATGRKLIKYQEEDFLYESEG